MKPNSKSSPQTDSQRLDTWLWASRFYKSRKLATEAIKGGHIAVNTQRAKPSKLIKAQDQVRIRKFPQTYIVNIERLSNKRLSAPLAAEMYKETDNSKIEREEKNLLMKAQRVGIRYDRQKPDKRDRQKMLDIKNQQPD